MHMDGSAYEYLLCCLFPPRLIFIAIPFILADINCYPSLRHISLFPTLLYSIFFIALAVSPLEPVRCIASLKIRRGVSQRRADSFQRCKKEIHQKATIKQGKEATRKAEHAPGIRQPSSCRVARSRPRHRPPPDDHASLSTGAVCHPPTSTSPRLLSGRKLCITDTRYGYGDTDTAICEFKK